MFYSIEGIDGAGCGVVRRALEKKLLSAKIKFTTLKYPVPNMPFGNDIYGFLDGKIEMPTEAQFLAFAGQMVIEKNRIKDLRKHILIVDRYLPCTLVFQGAKGFPLKQGLAFAKLFKMEMPDRIFYLKVPWRIAFERKQKEARQSDRFEKDIDLYKKTASLYDSLARKGMMSRWRTIDATQTPEEETEEIFKVISKDINNKR